MKHNKSRNLASKRKSDYLANGASDTLDFLFSGAERLPMRSSTQDDPVADVWYRIDLSVDEYEGGEADIIESAFRQIYMVHNAPPGMAMLTGCHESNSGYSVYFTPRSFPHTKALIRAYAALPAEAPPRQPLTLRAGDASLALGYAREF